jgi:hypothetical protein
MKSPPIRAFASGSQTVGASEGDGLPEDGGKGRGITGGWRPSRLFQCGRSAPVAALALFILVLPGAAPAAEPPPVPRVSPLKAAALSSLQEMLAASTRPDAFAADENFPAGPATALEAANDFVETAQDATAADDPLGQLPGDPIDLAPLSEPVEPFAASPDFTGLLDQGPIDLGAPSQSVPMPAVPEGEEPSGSYTLEARMTADGPPLPSGVVWRVFASDTSTADGMRLVGQANGGPVTLKLRPGDYFVHAAYGRAGVTRRVTIDGAPRGETVVLNAGGLRLAAIAGEDRPIAPEEVRFDIYAPDEAGSVGRVMIMQNAPASAVIGLNAGLYHVVCRYGDANAVVRADIRVEPGKLTEATVYQKAARVTLKLVEEHGGEALANTAWSVVTPAGESVVESVGAFPSVVLAAGEYTAFAKHDGRLFEHTFTVEPGLNRDVEVLSR